MEFKFFKPYESMYVDSKLPEIAEIRRQRYDENAASYDALQQKIASLRLEGDDVLLKDALQSDIDTLVSGNIGFENMDRTITAANQRVYEDTDLMDAMDTAATRRAELEGIDKLTASGKEVLRFDQTPRLVDPNDPSLGYEVGPDGKFVMDDKIKDQYTPTDGKYQVQAEERKDPLTAINTIVSGIARDPIVLQNLSMYPGLDPMTAAYYLLSGDKLDSDKIYELSDNMMKEFIVTEPGLQMKRELMEIARNPETGMLYTEQEAEAKIAELMYNSAAKQEGKSFKYSVNGYAKWMMDNAAPPEERERDVFETTEFGPAAKDFEEYNPITGTGEAADWVAQVVKGDDHYDTDPYSDIVSIGGVGGSGVNIAASVKRVQEELKKYNGSLAEMAKKAPGLFNDTPFKQSMVHYILDKREGMGALKDTEEFKDMTKEEYATAVLQSIISQPEKLNTTLPPKGEELIVQSFAKRILSDGVITINGKDYSAKDHKSLEALFEKNDIINLVGKYADLPGGRDEFDMFKDILQLKFDGVNATYKLDDDEFAVTLTPDLNFTGEDAGKLRFTLNIGNANSDPIEFSYQLDQQQAAGFELIQNIYKDLNAKNLNKIDKPIPIVNKTIAKEVFGDDKEYAYVIRPSKDGTMRPYFLQKQSDGKYQMLINPKTKKPISMDYLADIAETATSEVERGRGKTLSQVLKMVRETRTTFE